MLEELKRPITHPRVLGYYGCIFGIMFLLCFLPVISIRWRRIVVASRVPLKDALPSLITLALVFGMLAVGSLYSLSLELNR